MTAHNLLSFSHCPFTNNYARHFERTPLADSVTAGYITLIIITPHYTAESANAHQHVEMPITVEPPTFHVQMKQVIHGDHQPLSHKAFPIRS
jgi:hypothetical protein